MSLVAIWEFRWEMGQTNYENAVKAFSNENNNLFIIFFNMTTYTPADVVRTPVNVSFQNITLSESEYDDVYGGWVIWSATQMHYHHLYIEK